MSSARAATLATDGTMEPVEGTVEVGVPIDELWRMFARPSLWPWWNRCFSLALNRTLELGASLLWVFQPIRWWMPYRMPAVARIVELQQEGPRRLVTWEVTALPGFYARHTYFMESRGPWRTRFGSTEKAMGWSFRALRAFWVAHFTFVKDRSLEGARALERVFQRDRRLDTTTVKPRSALPAALGWAGAAALVAALAAAAWFYASFVRQQVVDLAPGVRAVLGGGGNALVVEGETEALVVDTKFPPGSGDLRHWVSGHVKVPVTRVVNTHYHYDHTLGNDLYPGATVLAHVEVPSLLREREPDQVREHPSGVPAVLVSDPLRLEVGGRELLLFHPGAGAAHTRGDLVVYLPREKVLAVGDLLFNGYYPFFDLGDGGADVPGLIRAARELAAKYPDATVVPGHGPIARAPDLLRYADYLEALWTQVQACRSRGCTEDQAAASIDLSRWGLSLLPSFHGRKLEWATAERNVRNAFHLAGALTP